MLLNTLFPIFYISSLITLFILPVFLFARVAHILIKGTKDIINFDLYFISNFFLILSIILLAYFYYDKSYQTVFSFTAFVTYLVSEFIRFIATSKESTSNKKNSNDSNNNSDELSAEQKTKINKLYLQAGKYLKEPMLSSDFIEKFDVSEKILNDLISKGNVKAYSIKGNLFIDESTYKSIQ